VPFTLTAATAAAMAPSSFELRNREFVSVAQHAFFATGRGDRTRIVAVDLQNGLQQTVAPYIWGDMGKFSVGNLLDEPHGLVYALDNRTLAGYEFAIDREPHQTLHRFADFQRAIELHERAQELYRAGRRGAAMSDATLAVKTLDALLEGSIDTRERVAIFGMLGDSHALVGDLSSERDRTEPRRRAVAAYEQALTALTALATEMPSAATETLRADLQARTRLQQQ
jgi:hypothetical protein